MKMLKCLMIIMVVISGLFVSGCTDTQDVSSVFNALPEVQQFLDDNPTANVNVVYWSSSEIETIIPELEEQFDKSVTPTAMYKAIVTDDDIEVVAWIDASTHVVLFTSTSYIGVLEVDVLDDAIKSPVTVPQLKTTPQLSLRLVEVDDGLEIFHQGGDSFNLSDMKITVYYKGSASYDVYEPVDIYGNMFLPGERLTITPIGVRHGRVFMTSDVSLKHLNTHSSSTSVEIVDMSTGIFLADLSV